MNNKHFPSNETTTDEEFRPKQIRENSNLDRINEIIIKNFNDEILYKQFEIEKINERVFEAQNTLDKLRALVLCRYYSLNGCLKQNEFKNHPSILEYKCDRLDQEENKMPKVLLLDETTTSSSNEVKFLETQELSDQLNGGGCGLSRICSIKICVGNVSKYLNLNKPQKEHNLNQTSIYDDNIVSHKWMCYVRAENCKNIDNYIKKVVFHLHQSYKPNDIVEICKPPFQLTKKGWGEFPIHVQIHFKDTCNKRIDILHPLKLDWTLTGLQTFGGETIKDEKLLINKNDYSVELKVDNSRNVDNKRDMIVEEEDSIKIDKNSCIENILTKKTELEEVIEEVEEEEEEEVVEEEDLNEDEEGYESINPTTTPIGKSCMDELILDLTNNSFDNNNMNGTSSLIDSFLTSSSSFKNQQILQIDQKYDESSVSSTTSSSLAVASPIQQQQQQLKTIKSSIDDLLNIRPKTIVPNSQPIKTSSSFPSLNLTQKQQQIPSSASNTIIKTQINELKSSPKKVTPLKVESTTKLSFNSTAFCSNNKSRPQITPVVKNEQTINQIKTTTSSSTALLNVNNNANNKKTVIYKIESKDTKLSSNGTHYSKQSEEVQRKRTKQNPLLTDHNTSLLTKLKTKCEPQQLNNETTTTSIKSPIVNNTSKFIPTTAIPPASTTTINSPTKSGSSVNNLKVKPIDTKIYTINDSLLNEVVKCVNRFDNYENYLKIAQKYSPIISKNANKQNSPFCARSLAEYFSWPCAKRRANEWMRALSVKHRANSMITKAKSAKLSLWSTKKVLIWLRANGYTPLDNNMIKNQCISKQGLEANTPNNNNNNDYISSLTPYDRLLNNDLDNIKINGEIGNTKHSSEFIDVIGDNSILEDTNLSEKVTKKCKNNAESLEYNSNYDYLLEMSNGGKYVREQLNVIDAKTNPVNLSSNIGCRLAEEFIFVVAKHFCEDLIRDTCSNIYTENVVENNNKIKKTNSKDYSHYLTKINVLDVFNTICKNEKYDFLTNNYMATINKNQINDQNNNNNSYDASFESKIK